MWNPFQSRPVASRTRGRTKAKKREEVEKKKNMAETSTSLSSRRGVILTEDHHSKKYVEVIDLGYSDDDDDKNIVSTEDSSLVPDEPLTSEGRSKENEEVVDLCVGFSDDDDDVESSSSGPDDPMTSTSGEDNDDSDDLDYWAEEEEEEEEKKVGEAREVFNSGGRFWRKRWRPYDSDEGVTDLTFMEPKWRGRKLTLDDEDDDFLAAADNEAVIEVSAMEPPKLKGRKPRLC